MIRAIERENFVAIGVEARHANRIFYAIGATVGEENFLVMWASKFDNPLCSFTASFIGNLRSNCC